MKKKNFKFNKFHIITAFMFAFVLLAPTCQSGITQRGTYPIEIFSEMHYSQAYKNQEPPRLDSVETSQKFITPDERLNDSLSVLNNLNKTINNYKQVTLLKQQIIPN